MSRAVYLVAFASVYVQIPGLYGHEGILPVDVFVKMNSNQVLSSLLACFHNRHHLSNRSTIQPFFMVTWLTPYITVDTALHVVALSGIVLSTAALMVQQNSCFVFSMLYLLYLSLIRYPIPRVF